jgi:hypothetical protein
MHSKKKPFLLLTIICFGNTHGTQDYKPNVVIAVNKETQEALSEALANALANAGSNVQIKEIPNIPLNLSFTPQTFQQLSSFTKLITALCFTLLGGFIFKNGLDNLDDKDKRTSSITKIFAGLTMSCLSLFYISKHT